MLQISENYTCVEYVEWHIRDT